MRSQSTKATPRTAAAAIRPRVKAESQPCPSDSISAKLIVPSASAISAAPSGSSRLACGSRDSATRARVSSATKQPIGTLIQNTELQAKLSRSSPPTIGPRPKPRPPTVAQTPIAPAARGPG